MSEPDERLVALEDEDDWDPYDAMSPFAAAAFRTANVIGCLGVIVGLAGGVFGGIAAYKLFGYKDRLHISLGILVGSAVPFFFTGLFEVSHRLALRSAKRKRMSVGTHAAFNAYRGDDEREG